MNTGLLIYTGSALPFLWGLAHLFPTKSVIRGFGEINADNRNIIAMEWVTEGVALLFIGTIVAVVTVIEPRATVSSSVYLASSGCLVVLSIVSLFTGFKIIPAIQTMSINISVVSNINITWLVVFMICDRDPDS